MLGVHEIEKDSKSIEAIGAVDELNSFVGLVINKTEDLELIEIMKGIQKDLFTIGAELAGSTKSIDKSTNLDPDHIVKLEDAIFKIDQTLKPLRNFILPGGCEEAALLHVARSVCRRAERRVITLKKEKIVNDDIIKYLNRLSYLFFLLARYSNERHGIEEHKW